MNAKIWITIISVLILGTTATVVIVYYPYTGNHEIDPDQFTSIITRNASNESYLPYLYSMEKINGSIHYFDSLGSSDARLYIENISKLIENEFNFLETYNYQDFISNEWRNHTFIYIGSVIESVNQTEFLSQYDPGYRTPYHFFYYNFTLDEYFANSTMAGQGDYTTWNILFYEDYIFSENPSYMLIKQTVEIGDIYAPLAGTGTSFERLTLCLPDGTPVMFFSNEGPWWIS